MTDFFSGDYAANQAQINDAWTKAKAAIAAQRQRTLQDYGYDAAGNLDPTNQYGGYQQIEHTYGTGTSRENEDYNTGVATAQKQSGLDFTNGGLQLHDDPAGAYQQMLTGDTRQLASLADSQAARGLGGAGLGARAVDQAQGDDSANRANYRNQLLDQFTANATNHTRNIADLDFQHGSAQNQLGLNMSDALAGLDQQANSADAQHGTDMNNAMLAAIMASLGTDNGLSPATPGAAKASPLAASIARLQAGRYARLGG